MKRQVQSRRMLPFLPGLAVILMCFPGDLAEVVEPSAPKATDGVQAIVDEAGHLLADRKPVEALAAADRALAAALEAREEPGKGYAHRARARALEALDRPEEALAAWREAARIWESPGSLPERIEALCAQALMSLRLGRDQDAAGFVDESLALAEPEAMRPLAVVRALNAAADSLRMTKGVGQAQRLATLALSIGEKVAPGSLDVAASLNNLGVAAAIKGDLNASKEYFERTLSIRERHAPGSRLVAGSIGNLGVTAWKQGDLVAAQQHLQRALAIHEKNAPGSLDVALTFDNLGNVAFDKGDLLSARRYHERALEILEKLAPDSSVLARNLSNLGIVVRSQGELAAARDLFHRSVAIKERLVPDSMSLAASLNNLGGVAQDQGDLMAAREYQQRALAIQEKAAPGSKDVGVSLGNLGNIAVEQGDLAAAKDYYLRDLAIQENHSPGSRDVGSALSSLGSIALRRGDFVAADDYFERALQIHERNAPGSINVGEVLSNLGTLAESRGDLEIARRQYERALAIQEEHAPGSLVVARVLARLGVIAQARGDLVEAERRYAQAWALVRDQRQAVIGDEAIRAFSSTHFAMASYLIQARVALKKPSEAFQVLEEGRAQALLQLLSERGLVRAGVDPDLWRRFEASERAFQGAGKELAEAGSQEARLALETAGPQQLGEIRRRREEALSSYTRARIEQERLLSDVRRSVPGLAPRTFSFEDARATLPRRSVFVAFSVGEKEGAAFLVPADPVSPVVAHRIPLGEDELAKRVDVLRERIGAGKRVRGFGGLASSQAGPTDDLVTAARDLYAVLFPVEARSAIDTAERILLSPDGPLWELPFAALVMNGSGSPVWLGLEKTLSSTPSLTVLALEQERKRTPSAAAQQVLIVGDPVFARAAESEAASTALMRGERSYVALGGVAPERLPASAMEARKVAALYGTEPLVGEAASEAAVRERLPRAAIVHLATHGYYHPKLAMSSGVLLTPPENLAIDRTDDDGVLQAWEFGATLPLVSELVVLSACETGRGEMVRAEGLVGLTRALQAAGGRSIVATHWKVTDESTANLMVSFHEHLRHGLAKDDALRRAMLDLSSRKEWSQPFYWAPFFLTGESDRPLSAGLIARKN